MRYQRARTRSVKRRLLLNAVGVLLVLAVAATVVLVVHSKNSTLPKPTKTAVQTPKVEAQKPAPKPPLINLQPVIDQWVAKQKGDFGIVVYDPDNQQIIGAYQPDKQYFTASIYKMYVVYLQLVDIQLGKRDPQGLFRGDFTRQKCIEEAIRISDSGCADALMAELGNADINARLLAFGLTDTSFSGFVTSANDAAKILERLQGNRDFGQDLKQLLLSMMQQQIYRNGLPLGMPEAVVADKVGFSETPNYHDIGIITLPNKRQYIVAILSEGASSRQVADFGQAIYAALTR